MATIQQSTVKGIKIREAIVGSGDPVLMIHGWGADVSLLQPLAQHLAKQDYQLFMPELPGFGSSAKPTTAFSIFDYADFCKAYLDARGLERVYYFGHSLGGRIGLIMGSEHSARINKMVLSNSAGLRAKPSLSSDMRIRLYRGIRNSLEHMGAKAVAENLRQSYNRRYGSADFLSACPIMRETLVKVVNQDLLAYARRVQVPTILIWGDRDQVTPHWMGQKLEAAIPDAALIVHAGAGHYAYLDFPEKTASIMHALFGGKD